MVSPIKVWFWESSEVTSFVKSHTRVFAEPKIEAALLSEDLLSEWITQTLRLEEEQEVKFRPVALVGEDQPAVTLSAKAQQDFGERAKAYKNSEDQKKVRVTGATIGNQYLSLQEADGWGRRF
jgi:hypothetical protein